ncbi:MAG TPA: hypothetical protein VMN58_00585 [Acidimicrobiales bacterium]|nr:hypothetical protein [Acidimicrobiales bacterium]
MADERPALLLDDRLLIEELLVGLDRPGELHTTAYWYYRACRAAVVGAGGQLSGPFTDLGDAHQRAAISSLLVLRDDIGLPDPRSTVPRMAELAERHPRLNLLNLEAAASALVLGATVLLSTQASEGVLPRVLDAERIPWQTAELS